MKKPILAIALCMAIVSADARSTDRPLTEGGSPSKKSTAVQRNILSDKLPSKLLTTIKKDYRSYWITGLYKEVSNGRSSYHITMENADQVITLSATPSTRWSVIRVVSKDQPAS
ncbi:MAG TPA: hypothetical protein VK563_02780 [Puia sp.]|nr:hypothetical protein [Puia sp.]